jgi:hypothetical protein
MGEKNKGSLFFKKRELEVNENENEEEQNRIIRSAVAQSGVEGAIVIICRSGSDGDISIQPLAFGLKKEILHSILENTIMIIKQQINVVGDNIVENETVN